MFILPLYIQGLTNECLNDVGTEQREENGPNQHADGPEHPLCAAVRPDVSLTNRGHRLDYEL